MKKKISSLFLSFVFFLLFFCSSVFAYSNLQFMMALWNNDLSLVESMLDEQPGLVNLSPWYDGYSPLGHAIDYSYDSMVLLLLQYGAETSIVNDFSQSAVELALWLSDWDMFDLINNFFISQSVPFSDFSTGFDGLLGTYLSLWAVIVSMCLVLTAAYVIKRRVNQGRVVAR